MFCPVCGNENLDGQAFCIACGSQLGPVAETSAPPSPLAAPAQAVPPKPASAPMQSQPYAAPQPSAPPQAYATPQTYAAPQPNAPQQLSPQPQIPAGSESGLAKLFDKIAGVKIPYNVVALIAACLVIVFGVINRILNYSVFNAGNFLFTDFFAYFFRPTGVTNVLLWIGVLLASVGCLAKNKTLIGAGSALGTLSAGIALFLKLSTMGAISNLALAIVGVLGCFLELGAFVFLALLAFGALKPEKAKNILLLPTGLMLVYAMLSLIGRLVVFALLAFGSGLAAAVLILACTVTIANMEK